MLKFKEPLSQGKLRTNDFQHRFGAPLETISKRLVLLRVRLTLLFPTLKFHREAAATPPPQQREEQKNTQWPSSLERSSGGFGKNLQELVKVTTDRSKESKLQNFPRRYFFFNGTARLLWSSRRMLLPVGEEQAAQI